MNISKCWQKNIANNSTVAVIFKYWIPVLLLVAIGVLVYYPTLGNRLQMGWDDGWMLLNNYTYRGFTWDNLQTIFKETWYGQYSPVNQLFYTIIYSIFGPNPMAYHSYSLLLHLSNVCFVFLLVYSILFGAKHTDEKTALVVAFCASLLFCIHPLQVEAIAWVSASKVLLYSFFTLSALLAHVKFICSGKAKYYILALILFLFSLGSKEQTVVLPVSMILIDWVMKRNMKTKDIWIEKLPFIMLAVFFGLFTLSMQSPDLVKAWAGYTFLQRLVMACYALVEYVVKLVLPVKLLYLYPFPMPPGGELPLRMLIYPVIILVVGIGLYIYRKNRFLLFGVSFFLVNVALTVHVAPMSRYNIVADRYIYLPSIGLLFVGVWYIVTYMQTLVKKQKNRIYAMIVCYLLYLGIYSYQRTQVWYDNFTLKREMIELIDQRKMYEELQKIKEK